MVANRKEEKVIRTQKQQSRQPCDTAKTKQQNAASLEQQSSLQNGSRLTKSKKKQTSNVVKQGKKQTETKNAKPAVKQSSKQQVKNKQKTKVATKRSTTTSRAGKKKSTLALLRWYSWIMLACGLLLFAYLFTEHAMKSSSVVEGVHQESRIAPEEVRKNIPSRAPTTINEASLSSAKPLSKKKTVLPYSLYAKKVDDAIRQALESLAFSSGEVHIANSEKRHVAQTEYPFRNIVVQDEESFNALISALQALLAPDVLHVAMQTVADNLVHINVYGVTTHTLHLQAPSVEVTVPAEQAPAPARLALVVDDIGESMRAVRRLLQLDFPVTLAVWPYSTHAHSAATEAHNAGREVLVHQPMEPLHYPAANPGEGALLVNMSDKAIRQTLSDAVMRVPYAVGLNNHMGSRFTQSTRGMRVVCTFLKEKELFALDSLTHGKSRFFEIARKTGVPSLKRSVFLDVVHTRHDVLLQLQKAERIAQQEGIAVAIGHPLTVTLDALEEWQRSRDTSVTIVTLQDLLREKS